MQIHKSLILLWLNPGRLHLWNELVWWFSVKLINPVSFKVRSLISRNDWAITAFEGHTVLWNSLLSSSMAGHRVLFTHESTIRRASHSTVSSGRVSTRQLSLREHRGVRLLHGEACIISVPSDLCLLKCLRPCESRGCLCASIVINHAGVHMLSDMPLHAWLSAVNEC